MSKIEWTELTWNPIVGCSKVSAGCQNCYAERMAIRLAGMGKAKYQLTLMTSIIRGVRHDHWAGVGILEEPALQVPLKRKIATTYFVCSMGDLFHESVPFEWIDKVFAVMALCPQHTFQVLTKRPERMAEYFLERHDDEDAMNTEECIGELLWDGGYKKFAWPLPNVWLGTTAENQEMADERIPHLLKCPAAKRFVSVEPMLGAVDLEDLVVDFYGNAAKIWRCRKCGWSGHRDKLGGGNLSISCPETGCRSSNGIVGPNENDGLEIIEREPRIDWVICGGESGPGARPMHPDWARSLRDQCKAAGVPFFMKQLRLKGCRKCRFGACTHLAGHKQIDILTKDIKEFPEDLRIREYPNV